MRGTRLRGSTPAPARTHEDPSSRSPGYFRFEEKIKDLQKRHDKLRDKIEQIRLSHTIDPFLEISYVGQVETVAIAQLCRTRANSSFIAWVVLFFSVSGLPTLWSTWTPA